MKRSPLRAAGVSLRTVLADLLTVRPGDVRATSCTSDARQVRKGDVFVAVTEADDDGHDSAAVAVRRGAVAVVCERRLPVFTVPQFVVSDSRKAYGQICQALVGNPSKQLKVIGVTGTSGKTTVVRLLTSILREAGATVGHSDSLGWSDGLDYEPTCESICEPSAADPSAPALARRLGCMAASGASHAVVEVSSRALSNSLLAGVELDAACVTHIGRDHLDWHGSLENYRHAKRRILEHLDPHGMVVLNADCQDSMRILAELNQPALTIGLQKPSEITAQIIEQHVNEQVFMLKAGDDSVGVRTAMVGDHHVYNCLTAAAMALAYGVELTTIARGLEAVERLPGRMERVMCGQNFALLVDAANSPSTLRACLKAARQVTTGRLICVFATDVYANGDQLPAMGRVAGALADVAVITSLGARLEGCPDFSRSAVNGFADPRKAHVILDRAEAIAWAVAEAGEGDTVLLAGMGDRTYPNPNTNELPWDDRDVARHVLNGAACTGTSDRIAA